MHGLENAAIDLVRSWFDAMGWAGVVLAMAIESACIPLPSEIIMPLAGWLIVSDRALGWQGILLASLCGGIGNLLGSVITYWVGALGGRPLAEKYGRWILVSHRDLDRAEAWFGRWGEVTTLLARLLPVVRTFISFPAGVARMNFLRFSVLTFLGSFLWCIPLTTVGYKWGPDWESFRNHARFLDYPIAAVILLAVAWFIWHRLSDLHTADIRES
jgi:membrane protein DedA with SNARE-associated domain